MENQNPHQKFEEVYHAHVKAIFRFVYFKVSDYETALDITQETFLKFWKALYKGQVVKNPKAFLFFIARGLVVDYYRRRDHRTHVPLEQIEGLIFTTDDLDNKLDKERQISQLFAKLHELREDYQDILILYYIEEVEVPDIAEIVQKTENAVRVLIHRALKELKGKL